MEIWERGVLKHQKMTTPRSLHTQTTLSFFNLNFPNSLRSSPPYIYFMSFMESEKKLLIVGYLLKEKNVCSNLLCGPAKLERTFIKTKSYSAFWEGFRAVGHRKRHRFFPKRTFFFSIHPHYACDTGLITITSGLCLSKRVPTEIRH